jgi:hypothetical protein
LQATGVTPVAKAIAAEVALILAMTYDSCNLSSCNHLATNGAIGYRSKDLIEINVSELRHLIKDYFMDLLSV